jgi:hypothetical protein
MDGIWARGFRISAGKKAAAAQATCIARQF